MSTVILDRRSRQLPLDVIWITTIIPVSTTLEVRAVHLRLSDKVLVVTGGNSGIGVSAAKLFVAEGAKVAITGRNETTLRQVAEALGPGVLALQADSNDYPASQRAFAQIAEQLGRLSGVFVNAGVGGVTPLGGTAPEAFEELVRANFTSAFFTAQAALPQLVDGASLVFNGSVLATLGMPGWSAYGGAKGAVRAMLRVLASELAPRRIRVNQVTPSDTKTPIWTPLAPTAQAQDTLNQRISASARPRRSAVWQSRRTPRGPCCFSSRTSRHTSQAPKS